MAGKDGRGKGKDKSKGKGGKGGKGTASLYTKGGALNSETPCLYEHSPQGCSIGKNCMHKHTEPVPAAPAPKAKAKPQPKPKAKTTPQAPLTRE